MADDKRNVGPAELMEIVNALADAKMASAAVHGIHHAARKGDTKKNEEETSALQEKMTELLFKDNDGGQRQSWQIHIVVAASVATLASVMLKQAGMPLSATTSVISLLAHSMLEDDDEPEDEANGHAPEQDN